MPIPHLVLSGARDYLANGKGDALHIFETRVEDAIGHVAPEAKAGLINEIVDEIEHSESSGDRIEVLLAFLDRQHRIVRGEL